ncbi:MAG: sigma-70 family RNA polymerase sigma factor [Acidobacteriaceae bacterium]
MRSADIRHPAKELELIERICAGEREPFHALIRPYEKQIYGIVYSILRNREEAEDVVQEALFKAFKALASFRKESRFSTWLIQIATNEALQRLRQQKRVHLESLDDGADGDEGDYKPKDFADWREIPYEALEQKELREALNRAIESMKPAYRNILVLRDIEQLTIAETAAALGLSEANVKVRLLRARLMLRDALAPGNDGAWRQGLSWKKVRPW